MNLRKKHVSFLVSNLIKLKRRKYAVCAEKCMDSSREFGEGMQDIVLGDVQSHEKLFQIIFIVDSSGSMSKDGKMEEVNNALVKLIPELRDIQEENRSKYELRISIMSFDEEAKWLAKSVPVNEYNHNEINANNARTFYHKAFNTLDVCMTRNDLFAGFPKITTPYIMFLTDGKPLDDKIDIDNSLSTLLGNGWFAASIRYAVLIGSEAINSPESKEAVKQFVSSKSEEGIINCEDATSIIKAVKDKTQKTINIMTRHPVLVDIPAENQENPSNDMNNNGGFGVNTAGNDPVDPSNPFGPIDPNALYSGGGTFR